MNVVLITGNDGSLGRKLTLTAPIQAIGITKARMEKRLLIEHKLDEYLDEWNITHVINNHGINYLSWLGTGNIYDERIIIENVLSPYWVIDHLVRRNQVCRVINIASATHRVSQRCTSLYCASKAALVQMTKTMARELAPKGWVINALAPGLIEDTKMAQLTNKQVEELRGWNCDERDTYARKMIPMGRYTNRAEVCDAVWKIFELPDYINGACIDMMGGV